MFEQLANQKGLSIDRLLTLCDIADKGSIKEATGDNAPRQAQYSRQIKELEEFLDIELLDRESRPSGVTNAGRELSELSRNYLSAIENFILKSKNRPSKLTIAAGESIIQWLMMPILLPVLKKKMPDTTIRFQNRQSKDILAGIKNGEFDIGILKESTLKEDRSVRNKPAKHKPKNMSYDYKLFIPTSMTKGLRNPITLEKLCELPSAMLEGNGELRKLVNELAIKNDLELSPVIECSSLTQILTLILQGHACGFLPAYVANTVSKERALLNGENMQLSA